MRFINLDSTARRTGKGQTNKIRFRLSHSDQTADAPTMAFGDGDTGLWESADDVLQFGTAGAAAMTIAADNTVTLAGNLVVSGTQTTVNSTTLTVDDKNLELGSVDTPSDTTADGGGITLKGATDKTFNWVDSTDAWTSSEHINLASGKTFQLNGTAITSTAAELNLLDGVTSTTTELNYTDGVTSAIQTQLNTVSTVASAALPKAGGTMTGALNVTVSDASITPEADADDLVVESNGASGITIGSSTSTPGSIRFADSGGGHQGMIYYNHSGDHMRFYTNATEQMRINSSGNVGINDTDPSEAKLSIVGTSSPDWAQVIQAYSSGHGLKILAPSTAAAGGLRVMNQAGNADYFFVRGDGKVGIKQSTPLSPSGSNAFLHIGNSSLADASLILEDDNAKWEFVSNDALTIRDNNTTRMMINSDGNVGIGATSTGNRLHVSGNINSTSDISDQHGNVRSLRVPVSYGFLKSLQMGLHFETDGTHGVKPKIQFDSGLSGTNYASKAEIVGGYDSVTGGAGGWLGFSTKNTSESLTTRMTIDSSGHVAPGADNTQNLGSSSLRWANIYTADMHLSNEGKEGGNEIDGTTGEWTIQEGDENIFVINKKTGKKFKIDLTEI